MRYTPTEHSFRNHTKCSQGLNQAKRTQTTPTLDSDEYSTGIAGQIIGYASVGTTDQTPNANAPNSKQPEQSASTPTTKAAFALEHPRAPSGHDETPLRLNGKGFHLVRPEGIEPPTYWV